MGVVAVGWGRRGEITEAIAAEDEFAGVEFEEEVGVGGEFEAEEFEFPSSLFPTTKFAFRRAKDCKI